MGKSIFGIQRGTRPNPSLRDLKLEDESQSGGPYIGLCPEIGSHDVPDGAFFGGGEGQITFVPLADLTYLSW